MSPYLFVLTAELYGISIRKNKNIRGITINNTEHKLTQYADDMNLFSLYDSNSLDSVINTFDTLHKQTGLTVNYDKTCIYRIGSLKNSSAQLYTQKSFKWVEGTVNVLGVEITHDKEMLQDENYTNVMKKIDNIIDLWNNRKLTIEGRVITVNILMSSQFVYKLACLDSPSDSLCDNYKKKITQYIWEGKSPKIAYNTLICSRPEGGLKLVDIKKKDKSMKIKWISRLKHSESLASIAYYFLPDIGEKIWECNLCYTDVTKILTKHSFWRDVLMSWCSYNYQQKTDLNAILNSIIWFNSDIKINDKPVFYKTWFHKGIIYITF